MNPWGILFRRLRALGQSKVAKEQIDEELKFHLEQRTAENIAKGMPPADAARDARKRFGNLQSVREECREVSGASFGEGMLRDLRFGLRMLTKSPGFTFVAVLTIAIGIGSATAIFSTVYALVIQPCSSPNAARLVQMWSNGDQPLSTPEYFGIHEQTASFAELGVYTPGVVNLGGDHPESIHGVSCTPGVLRAFGVAPLLGRWLEPSDEQKGAPPAVVISHNLWQRTFAGDPKIIGRAIRLNGANVTVVGVMPADFEFCSPWLMTFNCDIWRSLQLQREDPGQWWCVIGCLKPGVTPTVADVEIKTIGARLDAAHPSPIAKKPFQVNTLAYEMTRYGRSYAWMILGATVLMLLVACANVASMLLARSVRRHGEFGVRIALGATRAQIVRLAYSESILLAMAGTVTGAGLAAVTLRVMKFLAQVTDARREAITLDGHAFLFAAGLTLVTGFFAGLPPALAAMRLSPADLLRSDSRSAAGSRVQHRWLRGLVVAQIAVAFLLANLAVLFSASYANMLSANANMASDHVLSVELNLSDARYDNAGVKARFCERLSERVANLPGVAAAGTTTDLPLEWGPGATLLAEGEIFDAAVVRPGVIFSAVTPGYFAAADIPFLKGRTLEISDDGKSFFGVVVNRAFVEKYWPHEEPLGKTVRPNSAVAWYRGRVVGVVEDLRQQGVKSKPLPQLFWNADRAWGKTIFLVVHSAQPAAGLTPALREAVAKMDPDLPLARVRTFKAVFREATAGDRGIAGLTNYCMIVAIGLVAIGLYGTLSYHVLQRTREIGVRMALGAGRGDVLRLVFRQGFGWVLMGLAAGLGVALAVATAVRAMVYDINPFNPLSFAAAALAVALAATLACWLPARRAARVDPMEALRHE